MTPDLKIYFETQNGVITNPIHREIMHNSIRSLCDSGHTMIIKEGKGTARVGRVTPTRYKYLFDCVYPIVLPLARKHCFFLFQGEQIYIKTPEELHAWLKLKYNYMEVADIETGDVYRVPMPTKMMLDRDFIPKFNDSVLMFFSDHPFYIENIPDYEEYKEYHKEKKWHGLKLELINQNRK